MKSMHYPVIIAATHIRELTAIHRTNAGIRVGASVTLSSLEQTLKQAIQQMHGKLINDV